MAKDVKTLNALNEATEWLWCPSGLVDISIGAGLTGTVVLEQRIDGGSAAPVHDDSGTAKEWTTPMDGTIEVGGTDKREFRLRCSQYNSGSAKAFLGYQ